jgi:hypothetical protein
MNAPMLHELELDSCDLSESRFSHISRIFPTLKIFSLEAVDLPALSTRSTGQPWSVSFPQLEKVEWNPKREETINLVFFCDTPQLNTLVITPWSPSPIINVPLMLSLTNLEICFPTKDDTSEGLRQLLVSVPNLGQLSLSSDFYECPNTIRILRLLYQEAPLLCSKLRHMILGPLSFPKDELCLLLKSRHPAFGGPTELLVTSEYERWKELDYFNLVNGLGGYSCSD